MQIIFGEITCFAFPNKDILHIMRLLINDQVHSSLLMDHKHDK
jgi:hypothetical protein